MIHSESFWTCPDCRKTTSGINYANLMGIPVCPDCESDMEFDHEIWITDTDKQNQYKIGDRLTFDGSSYMLVMFDDYKDSGLKHYQLISPISGSRWSDHVVTHREKMDDLLTLAEFEIEYLLADTLVGNLPQNVRHEKGPLWDDDEKLVSEE